MRLVNAAVTGNQVKSGQIPMSGYLTNQELPRCCPSTHCLLVETQNEDYIADAARSWLRILGGSLRRAVREPRLNL